MPSDPEVSVPAREPSCDINGLNRIVQEEAATLYNRDTDKYSVHRHSRALIIVYGIFHWAAYYHHRYIDDILDDDRAVGKDEDPYEVAVNLVKAILRNIENGSFETDDPMIELGTQYLRFLLETNPFGDEYDPVEEYQRSVNGMLFDYIRAQNRTVSTQEQIDQYYVDTFESVLRISEMLSGTKYPEPVMDLLISGQGYIYSIRDLKDDWEQSGKPGIINIPQEVLAKAGVSEYTPYETLIKNAHIKLWMTQQCKEYQTKYNSSEVQDALKSIRKPGSLAFWFMTKGLLSNLDKVATAYLDQERPPL